MAYAPQSTNSYLVVVNTPKTSWLHEGHYESGVVPSPFPEHLRHLR